MHKLSVALLLSLLLGATCTRQLTQPQTMTITGSAALQGAAEPSGITVSLYHAVELDSTLERLQQQFPTVGFELSQSALFDHRLHEAVYTTQTDADGYYEFVDIPQAEYNVVIETPDYGWRTLYDVSDTQDMPAVTLYPEMRVAGILDIYTEWPAHQHVIVTGDVVVPEGSTLLIDKGAVVRVSGYHSISINGNLNVIGTQDNKVRFTSNKSLANDSQAWRSIEVEGTESNALLNHAVLTDCTYGIRMKNSKGIKIENSYFVRVYDTAVVFSEANNIEFVNNVIVSTKVGMRTEGVRECQLDRNIVFSTIGEFDESIALESNNSICEISNNIVHGFDTGIAVQYPNNLTISHNYMENCGMGFSFITYTDFLVRKVTSTITYNTIKHCTNITFDMLSTISEIKFNNILQENDNNYLEIRGHKNLYDLEVTENYWYDTDLTNISRRIKDHRYTTDGSPLPCELYIEPVKMSEIPEAFPQ